LIIGNLKKDLHHLGYMGNKDLKKIAEYILNTDFSTKIDGRHLVDGNRVCYNLSTYNTTFVANRPAEAHWEHIDFQYMVSGEESLGWAPYDKDMVVLEKYDEDRDMVTFAQVEDESFFTLKQGMYAVFFPNDVHRSGIQSKRSMQVRKAVFKVKI